MISEAFVNNGDSRVVSTNLTTTTTTTTTIIIKI
jgi:hypothetical protein